MSKKGEKYEKQYIIERICPICGKRFIKAPYHIYREGNIVVCCYNCHCELLRRIEAQKVIKPRVKLYPPEIRAKAIDMVVNQKMTRTAVAAELGMTPEIVSMWVCKYKKNQSGGKHEEKNKN